MRALTLSTLIALLIAGCSANIIASEPSFNYSLLFCGRDDCFSAFESYLSNAKSGINCAFYRADKSILESMPGGITAFVVADLKAKADNASIAKTKGIMHNKYCAIDGRTVITGSFNPTKPARGDYNDVLIINSSYLAKLYSRNSESLIAGGDQMDAGKVMLNGTLIEVRFCPRGNCASAVISQIRRAKSSIAFATYSFTHSGIANELIIKSSEGVKVSGIVEKSTAGSKYSKHRMLAVNGIDVKVESSRLLMHHKFFVIDNETVITGSFNPTASGDERNAENLIIINNKEIAAKYYEEFSNIRGGNNDTQK